MTTQDNDMAENPEIVNVRTFLVPRSLVFEAFRDPKQLAAWWGPAGFTNTISEFDFRPFGIWRTIMRGPDGKEYDNTSRFVEVIEPEKIVFDHLEPVHQFRTTMTFTERVRNTELTWRMRFESAEEGRRLQNFIREANEQNLDRLAAHLGRAQTT